MMNMVSFIILYQRSVNYSIRKIMQKCSLCYLREKFIRHQQVSIIEVRVFHAYLKRVKTTRLQTLLLANDAKVEYTAGTNVKLNNSFAGTFIHWELNFNNVNINYE